MNFEFSEDQQFIRDQARNFLTQECSTATVRSILDTEAPYDKDLWEKIVGLGWTAMTIPEQYDGLGMGYLELCVIAEELGRCLAPVPFSSSVYLASEALLQWGSQAQKQDYLPKLAAGELIGTVATSEGMGKMSINARVANGVLTGEKIPVADGDVADFAIVFALADDNQCLPYIVDLTHSEVDRTTLNSIDPSRSMAKVSFSNVPAELLEKAANEKDTLSRLFDKAAVLFAFEQIGGCQVAMEMGMDYTRERYAFGRPVASFQAIKHKFADMYVALELARSNAYYGAWALSTDAPDLPLAAATARVSASDAFYLISKENIQAQGGMGFTWEFDCHLFYRRAQLLSATIGAQPHWKERVTQHLLVAA